MHCSMGTSGDLVTVRVPAAQQALVCASTRVCASHQLQERALRSRSSFQGNRRSSAWKLSRGRLLSVGEGGLPGRCAGLGASGGDWQLWGLWGPNSLSPSRKATLQTLLRVTDSRGCLSLCLPGPSLCVQLPAREAVSQVAGETWVALTTLTGPRLQYWPLDVIWMAEGKGTAAEFYGFGS